MTRRSDSLFLARRWAFHALLALALTNGLPGCGKDSEPVLPTPSTPSTSPLVFRDETFTPGEWTATSLIVGPAGGSGNAAQKTSGGNPGFYREIFASKSPTTGTGESGSSWVYSLKGLWVYRPTEEGAIASIDFAIDGIQFVQFNVSGGSVGLAIQQNNTLYFAPHPQSPAGQLPVPETSWTHKERLGLVASDFVDHDRRGLQPNFSAAGLPITLGFVYWVSTQVNGGLSERTAGFDNLSITIRR